MLTPTVRHVSTCLNCGFREPTRLTNSYPERCPNDGRQLEHDVVPFDQADELAGVRREGIIRRGVGRRGSR